MSVAYTQGCAEIQVVYVQLRRVWRQHGYCASGETGVAGEPPVWGVSVDMVICRETFYILF